MFTSHHLEWEQEEKNCGRQVGQHRLLEARSEVWVGRVPGEGEVEGEAVWAAAGLPPPLPPGTWNQQTSGSGRLAGASASSDPGAPMVGWGAQLTIVIIVFPVHV